MYLQKLDMTTALLNLGFIIFCILKVSLVQIQVFWQFRLLGPWTGISAPVLIEKHTTTSHWFLGPCVPKAKVALSCRRLTWGLSVPTHGCRQALLKGNLLPKLESPVSSVMCQSSLFGCWEKKDLVYMVSRSCCTPLCRKSIDTMQRKASNKYSSPVSLSMAWRQLSVARRWRMKLFARPEASMLHLPGLHMSAWHHHNLQP